MFTLAHFKNFSYYTLYGAKNFHAGDIYLQSVDGLVFFITSQPRQIMFYLLYMSLHSMNTNF